MKQVYLNFKELTLGYLKEDKDLYVWVPNIDSINIFSQKYSFAKDSLLLSSSAPEVYTVIPAHFIDFVESSNRADLRKSAGIEQTDSDFEKLYKMATLSYFNQDYFISI